MYQRILVTNDGSPRAGAALPHAAALVGRVPNAGILVLRVSHDVGTDPALLRRESWDAHVHDLAASGAPTESDDDRLEAFPPLADAVATLHAAGVRSAGKLLIHSNDAGPAIAEAADRLGCDLIVMSTHGLSGLRRAVLGSVADYVIRNAPGIPVLLCPPTAE